MPSRENGPDPGSNGDAIARAQQRVNEADAALRAAREVYLEHQDADTRDAVQVRKRELNEATSVLDELKPPTVPMDALLGGAPAAHPAPTAPPSSGGGIGASISRLLRRLTGSRQG